MLDNVWFVAAIWMGLAFVASLVSIRLGISVALVEIFVGILAGNFLGIQKSTEWVNFLAMLGSADFNKWMMVFVVVMSVTLWYMPRWTKFIIDCYG